MRTKGKEVKRKEKEMERIGRGRKEGEEQWPT